MNSISFSEFDLENGLHCIVYPKSDTPIATIDLWYHVGSKNEDPHRTGFAHLFEHLMFQGSANVGKTEHFNFVQEAGGNLNGSTNFDRTNYYETLPATELDLGLWLEADRMRSLNVNQENFENQRLVVMEERRQRYDNAPYGRLFEELHQRAYSLHPYRWIPIGTMEHLMAATVEDAQQFFHHFYVPNNATLVVAGDVNPDVVREKVEHYFGDISQGQEVFRPKNEDTELTDEIRDTLYDNTELPAIFIAYKICNNASTDADALAIISSILSDGRSSRLYRKLVHEERLAQSVSTNPSLNEHDGLFHINLFAKSTSKLNELEVRFDEELQKILIGDISEQELEKAKNTCEMSLVRRFSSGFGVAETLAYFHTYFKKAGDINLELEKVRRINLNDLQRVANKYLSTKHRVILHWLPNSYKSKLNQ